MTAPIAPPVLIGDLGTPELLIILAVVVLLFGSSKLPELARGSGRALRIFKAETKGLMDDDDTPVVTKTAETPENPDAATTSGASGTAESDLDARRRELALRQAELDADRRRISGESAAN